MKSICGVSAACALLFVAGCGGNDDAAQRWAETVCPAVATWRTQTFPPLDRARNQPEEVVVKAEHAAGTTTALDAATRSTDSLIARVRAAGTIPVDNGRALSDDLLHSLSTSRAAFVDAKAAIGQLPRDDPTVFVRHFRYAFVGLASQSSVPLRSGDTRLRLRVRTRI
jgi:hypothetical protein